MIGQQSENPNAIAITRRSERDYHQSFVQPDFRTEKVKKRGSLSGDVLLSFLCLRPQKGTKETHVKPWYVRKSGKSPGQEC